MAESVDIRTLFVETSINEHAGEIVSASMVVAVPDYVAGGAMWTNVLAEPEMPKPGDFLEGSENVKVIDRTVTAQKQSNGKYLMRVEIQFELQRPVSRPVRGGTTLSQIRTRVYPSGVPIVVKYSGDQAPAGEQKGEVTVMAPEGNVVLPLTKSVKDPDKFVSGYIGKVNSAEWRNGAQGRWLCTRGDWELAKDGSDEKKPQIETTDVYNFEFEFQRSSDTLDGWSVTAAYKDPQSRAIPADATSSGNLGTNYPAQGEQIDFSIITYSHYDAVDFSAEFPWTPAGN